MLTVNPVGTGMPVRLSNHRAKNPRYRRRYLRLGCIPTLNQRFQKYVMFRFCIGWSNYHPLPDKQEHHSSNQRQNLNPYPEIFQESCQRCFVRLVDCRCCGDCRYRYRFCYRRLERHCWRRCGVFLMYRVIHPALRTAPRHITRTKNDHLNDIVYTTIRIEILL